MSTAHESRIVAIRGATTVVADDASLIREATRDLLERIVAANALTTDDIISVIFTVTTDLRADFPAHAARELGWMDVPLLCTIEMAVPGALPRCIRVLLHAHSRRPRAELRHIYVREARALRPDLAAES
jgi:chorismate mutase